MHSASMFSNIYQGKKILVTGHTGFKGSWLTTWLLQLGADVIGLSLDIPSNPAMFNVLELAAKIKHIQGDMRDLALVTEVLHTYKPDFVFHLAAQAIVSLSYQDPVGTMSTNIVGTLHILEALRSVDWPCAAVIITSDKCYDNVEWVWGYRETDALGGKDIYSGSKAAAEMVIKSYYHSFFLQHPMVTLAVGRAGNVIGGGDWAKDRIVVDCMRAWSAGHAVEIRCPEATRPWQHVLEPLSGYLLLGQNLAQKKQHGEAFNFGPRAEQNRTVRELLHDIFQHCSSFQLQNYYAEIDNIPFHEAGLLKLNCDKALFHLSWEPNLAYAETIRFTGEWYSAFYGKETDMYALTLQQINHYIQCASERERIWVQQ